MGRLAGLLMAVLLAPLAAEAGGVKFVTLPPRIEASADSQLGPIVTELLVDSLGRTKDMHALGPNDVEAFLDAAAQTRLLSCEDEVACLSEIGTTLGVDYLVGASLGALGTQWIMTLRFFSASNGALLSRSSGELSRQGEGLTRQLCPLVQKGLVELSRKDPRVLGAPAQCPDHEPLVSEEFVLPPEEILPALPVESSPSRWGFGARLGAGAHAGILGVGLEARHGRYSLNLGTGTYTLTAAASVNLTTFDLGLFELSPYGSLHFAWTLEKGLFGIRQRPGASAGASAGVEVRPLKWLNVRAGAGFAYNPQTWGSDAHLPLVWDGTVGVLF